jgi:hypothetical protein
MYNTHMLPTLVQQLHRIDFEVSHVYTKLNDVVNQCRGGSSSFLRWGWVGPTFIFVFKEGDVFLLLNLVFIRGGGFTLK